MHNPKDMSLSHAGGSYFSNGRVFFRNILATSKMNSTCTSKNIYSYPTPIHEQIKIVQHEGKIFQREKSI